MIVNASNISAMYTSFSTLFAKGMASVTPFWPKIAMRISSSGKINDYPLFDQLPGMREWLGDRQYKNLTVEHFQITNKNYELSIEVDRDDIEDDNLGVYNPIIQNLGQQALIHRDSMVATLLKNAFATTVYTCYDSKAMCATDHSLGSKTFNNKGTGALSAANLATAYETLFSAFTSEDVIVTIPTKLWLVVAPYNYQTAWELCNAKQVLGDGTAGGAKDNAWKGIAEPLTVPLLNSSATYKKYWFLIAEFGEWRPLILQVRKEPQFVSLDRVDNENVFDRRKYVYGVDDRKNVGWGPYTLIYGSTGAS